MMSLRPLYVLSAIDVLDVSSQLEVNVVLETIFDALHSAVASSNNDTSSSSREVIMPHRTGIEGGQHTTLFMPSKLKDCMVVKVVSIPTRSDNGGGLPATTLMVDENSGVVDAVVNARSLTALRTAAGGERNMLSSTIATKLALESVSSFSTTTTTTTRLVLFGAGAQTQAHARLLIASFPSIEHITVVNRSDNARLRTLVDQFRAEFGHVGVTGLCGTWPGDAANSITGSEELEKAVRGADIIVTATSSTVALFPSAWVKGGAHINLIGSFTPSMREVEDALIERARVVLVDSRAACAREAGELISANVDWSGVKCVELGACTWTSRLEGGDGDVTVYKSVGVSVMDAAITELVVRTARERGRGIYVPFD